MKSRARRDQGTSRARWIFWLTIINTVRMITSHPLEGQGDSNMADAAPPTPLGSGSGGGNPAALEHGAPPTQGAAGGEELHAQFGFARRRRACD